VPKDFSEPGQVEAGSHKEPELAPEQPIESGEETQRK
jgi:hypothetical protein